MSVPGHSRPNRHRAATPEPEGQADIIRAKADIDQLVWPDVTHTSKVQWHHINVTILGTVYPQVPSSARMARRQAMHRELWRRRNNPRGHTRRRIIGERRHGRRRDVAAGAGCGERIGADGAGGRGALRGETGRPC